MVFLAWKPNTPFIVEAGRALLLIWVISEKWVIGQFIGASTRLLLEFAPRHGTFAPFIDYFPAVPE
jgi:hypothetical protein